MLARSEYANRTILTRELRPDRAPTRVTCFHTAQSDKVRRGPVLDYPDSAETVGRFPNSPNPLRWGSTTLFQFSLGTSEAMVFHRSASTWERRWRSGGRSTRTWSSSKPTSIATWNSSRERSHQGYRKDALPGLPGRRRGDEGNRGDARAPPKTPGVGIFSQEHLSDGGSVPRRSRQRPFQQTLSSRRGR